MTLVSSKWRDPALEAIRNSVHPPPSNDAAIDELIRKSKDIHLSFLLGPEGKRLHDELCLNLSSTKQSPLYSGWEDFGYQLGINPQVLSYLGNGLTREDPTYYILRAHAYNGNSTIGNVIEALRKIKRSDIIIKNYDMFVGLADEVHHKYRTTEESGYVSLSEGTVESSNGYSEDDVPPCIIKPPYNLINIPNILKSHSTEIPDKCTVFNVRVNREKQDQQLVRAAPIIKTRDATTKPKYGIKVMLTFASDGYELAKEVAKIMREKRDGLPRIGVLILQEQLAALAEDDQLFISGSFNQSIIWTETLYSLHLKENLGRYSLRADVHNRNTRGGNCIELPLCRLSNAYKDERLTLKLPKMLPSSAKKVSNNIFRRVLCEWLVTKPIYSVKDILTLTSLVYVRYIYKLMTNNFIENGCFNKKCRCLIPDEFLHSALSHIRLTNEPLFRVWMTISETAKFSKMLLRATLSKRK